MSAFIVDKKHIDAMVTYGLKNGRPEWPMTWHWPELTDEPGAFERGEPWGAGSHAIVTERKCQLTMDRADRTGQELMDQNYASVNHRYDEGEKPKRYQYEEYHGTLSEARLLAAVGCYEYQSCEDPGWKHSRAYQICQALKEMAIHKITENQGWEIKGEINGL